jgi:hypothetical protein
MSAALTAARRFRDDLLIKITERAALADRATKWSWDYGSDSCYTGPDTLTPQEAVFTADGKACIALTGDVDDAQSIADADFIAAHDPADSLRRCQAESNTVARHAPHLTPGGVVCERCANQPPYPCADVRDIAAVYNHPHADARNIVAIRNSVTGSESL